MPLYADKYEVRNVIRSKVGTHILNKLYGVFENVDEIDFDLLPESFVLKQPTLRGGTLLSETSRRLMWKKQKRK